MPGVAVWPALTGGEEAALRLHGYFRSSAAWRVRIALNLKGIVVEPAFRHLRHGGQRAPDYLCRCRSPT